MNNQNYSQQQGQRGYYPNPADAYNQQQESSTSTTTTVTTVQAVQQANNRQQHGGNDYSHLLTPPPPPAPPQPQPWNQQQQIQGQQSAIDYSQLLLAPPVVPTQSNTLNTQSSTQLTTHTVKYEGWDDGGKARKAAAAQGADAVRQFGTKVERLLISLGASYPFRFQWYNTLRGYVCGGGNHFVSHENIEQ